MNGMRGLPRFALFMAMTAILVFQARGQFNVWNPEDGVPLRQGRHVTYFHHGVAGDGNDHYLVTWTETPLGYSELRAQLYSPTGEPAWEGDPLTLADNPWIEQDTRVHHLANGNWLVAWLQYPNYDPDLKLHVGEIMLQQITPNGEVVWPQPVATGLSGMSRNRYDVQPSGADGAIVFGSDLEHEYLQKFDGNGEPVWDETFTISGVLYMFLARLVPDGAGGAYLVYHAFDQESRMNLRLQHVDAAGVPAWGEFTEGVLLVEDTIYPSCALVPLDESVFVAYTDVDEDSHVQVRANVIGLDDSYTWGQGGSVLLQDVSSYGNLYAESLSDGDIAVLVDEYDDAVMQKVDPASEDGAPLWNGLSGMPGDWGENGQYQAMNAVPGGGMIVTSISGSNMAWLSYVRPTGVVAWSNVAYSGGADFADTVPVGDYLVTLFPANTSQGHGLRQWGLNIDTMGSIPGSPFTLLSGIDGNVGATITRASGDRAFSTWIDFRTGNELPYLQIQDLATGENLLEEGGIFLFPGLPGEQLGVDDSKLTLTDDLQGGMYLVWTIEYSGSPYIGMIRGQHIGPDGQLLWGPSGRQLMSLEFYGYNTPIAATAPGGELCLAASRAYDSYLFEVVAQRYTPAGDAVWPEPVTVLGGEDSDLFGLQLTETGEMLVAGQIGWSPNSVTVVRKVALDGTIAEALEFAPVGNGDVMFHYDAMHGELQIARNGDDGLCLLAMDIANYTQPENLQGIVLGPQANYFSKIGFAGSDLVLATVTEGGLVLKRFDREGTPLYDPEGIQLFEMELIRPVGLVPDPDGGVWTIIQDITSRGSYRYTHTSETGELADAAYGSNGLSLKESDFNCYTGPFAPDGVGGFVVSWEDSRASLEGGDEYMIYNMDAYAMRINDFTTAVREPGISPQPLAWSLMPAYPNPFNLSTTLGFTVPQAGLVRLSVYDILGREVIRLVDGTLAAGEHRVVWNGRSAKGREVASGVYLLRLEGNGTSLMQRAVLLK